VGAEGQGETVLGAEFRQHRFRLRLGVDRCLKVVRDGHALAAAIGAGPAAIGLRRLDLFQTVFRHPALGDQSGDIVDIDLAPDALPRPRRVALQVACRIETLAHCVDPAPAQDDIDRLFRRDGGSTRGDLVDLDPDLVLAGVVFA